MISYLELSMLYIHILGKTSPYLFSTNTSNDMEKLKYCPSNSKATGFQGKRNPWWAGGRLKDGAATLRPGISSFLYELRENYYFCKANPLSFLKTHQLKLLDCNAHFGVLLGVPLRAHYAYVLSEDDAGGNYYHD